MGGAKGNAVRKSLLELAPLECDCMNALWPLGEATVHEIRNALTATRPRAYTTIMTIMDRLAHKGVVARRKVGKAYRYSANLSADDARSHAVAQVVESFFGGSSKELAAHLGGAVMPRAARAPRVTAPEEPPRAAEPDPEVMDATLL